ncbi:synaptonemal complex central element protein 2-like isoform X2 [Tachypleus tridentatus]
MNTSSDPSFESNENITQPIFQCNFSEALNINTSKHEEQMEGIHSKSIWKNPTEEHSVKSSMSSHEVLQRNVREHISREVEETVEKINLKRKQDTSLLAEFKRSLEIQINRTYSMVEESMYSLYEKTGNEIESKLQELSATLERISKLETELQDFRSAFDLLYQDLQHSISLQENH